MTGLHTHSSAHALSLWRGEDGGMQCSSSQCKALNTLERVGAVCKLTESWPRKEKFRAVCSGCCRASHRNGLDCVCASFERSLTSHLWIAGSRFKDFVNHTGSVVYWEFGNLKQALQKFWRHILGEKKKEKMRFFKQPELREECLLACLLAGRSVNMQASGLKKVLSRHCHWNSIGLCGEWESVRIVHY